GRRGSDRPSRLQRATSRDHLGHGVVCVTLRNDRNCIRTPYRALATVALCPTHDTCGAFSLATWNETIWGDCNDRVRGVSRRASDPTPDRGSGDETKLASPRSHAARAV